MAAFVDVPFAMQEGKSGPIQNSAETLINMFCEAAVSGRSQLVRRQRPCLQSVYAQTGEKRCLELHNGIHYAVIGNTLYRFDGSALTLMGTLTTASGRCSMVFNDNDQIMISDGTTLTYWNGTALASVTNTAGFLPGNLGYLNGYAIVNALGTDTFYISPANDFSQIDPLDFATAESNPDPLRAVFTDHNEIWLAGTTTIEIWQDTGGADFPFQSIPAAKIERGTAAALSFAADDNTVLFLGNDLMVYRAEGFRPVPISTDPINEAIRKVSTDGQLNAYALIYTIGGHKFYTLTFPNELTIQYNLTTGLWNRAQTYGSSSWDVVGSNGHFTDYYLTAAGFCSLSFDINQDESAAVIRTARSAPGWTSGQRITIHEMFADCEMGRPPLGVTPEVMLRVALDGETFGNSRVRGLGSQGAYKTRAVWRWLGQGRKPVLELSAAGNFNFAVMGVEINAEMGAS